MNHLNLKKVRASLGSISIALSVITFSSLSAQAAAIRSGFDGNTLAANDDDSTGLVSLGFDVNFFGLTFDELYVNNNGNVTFDSPLSLFTPFDLTSTAQQIIAPFFADVDTRNSDPVTYSNGTVDGRNAFGVNWIDVGYFYQRNDPLNSFQLVLIDRSDIAVGDFDIEFNYDQILWETGEASEGTDGLGGFSARAGFSNGTGDSGTFFELQGSAINGAFLNGGSNALISNSLDSDVDGRYIFSARNGAIDTPDPVSTPEPFFLLGLLTVGVITACSTSKQSKNN
ncbi:MAG: VPLPA-CTERM sorting domain-containing protein [Cyanobacterium sp. T60_A2020_053]|nr:VPLPA-CTERM sorting domain-containing protein [Cyanobacterium sp. T60_A2020_053]